MSMVHWKALAYSSSNDSLGSSFSESSITGSDQDLSKVHAAPSSSNCDVDVDPTGALGYSADCKAAMKAQCHQTEDCNNKPDSQSASDCAQVATAELPAACQTAGGPNIHSRDSKTPDQPPPQKPPAPTPPAADPGKQAGTGGNKNGGDNNNNNNPTVACSATADCQDSLSNSSSCDTSQSSSFASAVSPQQKSGSYGVTNGAQQINNVVTACKEVVDDCSQNSKCGASCVSQSLKDKCNQLSDNYNTLTDRGQKAINDANNQLQNQNSGMNPSSTNNNNNNNQPTPMSPSNATSGNCSMNPVACSNQQASAQAVADSGEKASMTAASAGTGIPNAAGMNVGNMISGKQSAQFADSNQGLQPQQPMNPYGMGGGGSSGSGFGSNSNQSPNAGAPARHAMASSHVSTDVLGGERSGSGGYTGARGIASIADRSRRGGGAFGGFNFGGVDEFGRMRGLDLKAYLPGGRQDPTHHMSGVNFAHPDVHGMNENIFVVITNRFQVHCKLQMLFDCR